MSSVLKTMSVVLGLLFVTFVSEAAGGAGLIFSCAKDNDLFVAVKRGGGRALRFDSPAQAVGSAPEGSSVLILADDYPTKQTQIDAATMELVSRKRLRLFLEFPASLPGTEIGPIRSTTWERGVVTSGDFGDALPEMSLLAIHGCHFVSVPATNSLIVMARVAGYDKAVFGLPKESFPILFELPKSRMLVATTRLSGFVRGRYAPTANWVTLWQGILQRLDPAGAPYRLKVEPVATASYRLDEKLPRHFEQRAIERAADWIRNAQLLVPQSRQHEVREALTRNAATIPPSRDTAVGDGSLGILEGYASGILADGRQPQCVALRCDCQTESAMVLALRGGKKDGLIASRLMDFTYFNSGMCQGVRADPKHPAFGLIGWGDISPAWLKAHYGDDNARTMLATILASTYLKTNRWDEAVARALLANFRTTGKQGFRTDRIDVENLEANGWKFYRDHAPLNFSPHFESYLWACNLWAYRQTGFRPLFDKTTNAIALTMKAYPKQWRWKDNMERARMLLCLAWLVRLEDTPEHRAWLKGVAMDLLKQQQPCGSLHDVYLADGTGHYQLPKSNEAYGTTETPLIQENGDPSSDQLYVSGFALFGLHEAVVATGDVELKRAEDKLAEFLCRIQIRSEKSPWLDGWWFRAFDDKRWESWASSADVGWGAWCLEAGWAQAWSVATLALRQQQTSFWDFTAESEVAKPFAKWRSAMLED